MTQSTIRKFPSLKSFVLKHSSFTAKEVILKWVVFGENYK